ncbi:MAG TPA: sulfatase [Wenzhouxiangellaceae bacterium]|nr:sulfatase [Wenzhouxiangellaceae bacterium]
MKTFCSLRRVAAGAAALAAATLLSGCSEQPEEISAAARVSNVVMICVDTVRWDTWWIPERAGFEDAFSPWAGRSQTMAHALSAAPWTVPSVASILTGLYPSQHGGGLFADEVASLSEEVPSAINPAVPTLAEMLAQAGVSTAAVSSHPWFQASYGLQRGFGELKLRSGAENVTGRGMEWLDSTGADADRFFLYLHYMDVHDPHLNLTESRKTAAAMQAGRKATLIKTAPDKTCDDPESDMCVRYLTYAEETLKLRVHIGSVLEQLEQRGLLESTLVLLYSDHGEEFHDHLEVARERNEDPRGIYGFGHGQSLYQELLHVPLQIWHPAYTGREITEPVSLVDVVPSLLDWLGLQLPADIDFPGRSFADTVERSRAASFAWDEDQLAQTTPVDRDLFASGIAYGPEKMAVVRAGQKLIWHQIDNTREYYDLRADPLETNPDPPESARRADELDEALDRYFDWFGSQDYLPPELSDEVVEKLKGVGYLQGVESKESTQSGDGDSHD